LTEMEIDHIVYSLYVNEQFIEHFASIEDALAWKEKYAKGCNHTIKPIIVLKFKKTEETL